MESQYMPPYVHNIALHRLRPAHAAATPVNCRELKSRRGIVLIVVIALLAMLALMGTIFILSAATDKQVVYASNTSAGLSLAQSGVLNTLAGDMLNATLDQNGNTLALGSYNASAGTYAPDSHIARLWDCPRAGNVAACTPSASQPFFQTITGGAQSVNTEPWLTNVTPWEPYTNYLPGMTVMNVNLSTTPAVQSVYVCVATHTSGVTFSGSASNWTQVNQIASGEPLISEFGPYLYDPNDGLYDISYQSSTQNAAPSGSAAVAVPNASVTIPAVNTAVAGLPYPFGTRDAMWNLMPLRAPNGVRYRFAVRVVDTSARLNLNTGWVPAADGNGTSDPVGIYGTYPTSCPIFNIAGLNFSGNDTPAALQNGTSTNIGRGGTLLTGSSYTPLAWQTEVINDYEQEGAGTGGNGGTAADLFNVNSAIDLLTQGGGVFGTPAYTRPMMLAPNTFGFSTQASYPYYIALPWRNLYTTSSYTRDIASLNLSSTNTPSPARVNLNAPISSSNFSTFSQQLYNTLIACGFNPQHACAWLVDYMTYRLDSDGYSGSPAYLSSSGVLTVPTSAGTLSASLSVNAGGQGYVGNTAQPFINQFDEKLGRKSGSVVSADWAVELANPFPGSNSLPLSDYSLKIIPKSGSAVTISLSSASLAGYNAGSNKYLGVVCYSGGTYKNIASSAGDGFVITSGATLAPGPITIELIRNNIAEGSGSSGSGGPGGGGGGPGGGGGGPGGGGGGPGGGGGGPGGGGGGPGGGGGGGSGGGASTSVVVDSMTVAVPTSIPGSVTYAYAYSGRNNSGIAGIWGCDSAVQSSLPSTLPTTDPGTIGYASKVSVSGNPGVPLYDRFYSGSAAANGSTAIDSNDDFFNINDVNCCARQCATTNAPLPEQLEYNTPGAGTYFNQGMVYPLDAAALSMPLLPDVTGTHISYETYQAALYFDFAYDPRAASTVADENFTDPAVTAGGGVPGEIAPSILTMTTLADRTSNTTDAIALPNGAADLVRMPGKVDVNTADQDVLYTAMSEDAAAGEINAPANFSGGTFNPVWQMVADIIAYRNRMSAGQTVATGGMATVVPADWYATSSGRYGSTVGMHSLGDLLLAFIPSESLTNMQTLQQRDAAWGDAAGFLTVRTDTFAVYGYIQALILNPQWTQIASYQPTDWYNANRGIPIGEAGSISTDPTANAEFILEGSRRFIAVIDRSLCNDGASFMPQIAAIKSLP